MTTAKAWGSTYPFFPTHLRSYKNFEYARSFVQTLGLKSEKGGRIENKKALSWRNYTKGHLKMTVGLPLEDIPINPASVYADQFISWGDWLGTGRRARKDAYLDFASARNFALKLNLHKKKIVRASKGRKNDARNKWQDYCLGYFPDLPPLPKNVPSSIHHQYNGSRGFNGYRHFITPD